MLPPIAMYSLAHSPTITAYLLYAWEHPNTILGEYAMQDALRMDTQRSMYFGIESALASL